MNKFIDGLRIEANYKKTENGMIALNSTGSSLLDIFGSILSMRLEKITDIENKFIRAFNEDKNLTLKLLFYIRSIRTIGQGEREVFRKGLKVLARAYPSSVLKNMKYIKEFGRIDDLYALVDTPLEKDMFIYLKNLVNNDLNESSLSLTGKWLKSINASNPKTRALGRLTAKNFGLSLKEYRKLCASLRFKLSILENKLRLKDYAKINYSTLPSQAFMKYYQVFRRNDKKRFDEFLNDAKKEMIKLNASTLNPYQIVLKYTNNYYYPEQIDETLEIAWNNLPKWINGNHNALAIVDTSASMYGLPYAIAASLGIYLATNNNGVWKNKLITFSNRPRFIELCGESLYEKLKCFTPVYGNTNIEAVFKLILNTAIKNNLKSEDMPERIIIISDMQFDEARSLKSNELLTDNLKYEFRNNGFKLPQIVYWNTSLQHKSTFHAYKNSDGAVLVSGVSSSIFMDVLIGKFQEPYEYMIKTLNNKTFDMIKA